METNIPRNLLPDLAELATEVGREQTFRAVVNHPLVGSGFDVRGSIQIPDVEGIRVLAAGLFPVDGSLPDADYALAKPSSGSSGTSAEPSAGTPDGSGVGGCAPAPRPKPTPTPKPTAGPTATPAESASPSTEPEPSGSPDASPSAEPSPTIEVPPPADEPQAEATPAP